MTIPETTHPACAANEARVRASGINLTTEYRTRMSCQATFRPTRMCPARHPLALLPRSAIAGSSARSTPSDPMHACDGECLWQLPSKAISGCEASWLAGAAICAPNR